jgi:hypothetical protein
MLNAKGKVPSCLILRVSRAKFNVAIFNRDYGISLYENLCRALHTVKYFLAAKVAWIVDFFY